MAKFIEVHGDLFRCPLVGREEVGILHCISSDFALGAGFALKIENKYSIREKLIASKQYTYPNCIIVDGIVNMVTKGAYWDKPNYRDFEQALAITASQCKEEGITTLLMPRIGCGLDKLEWKKCKKFIEKYLVEQSEINCIAFNFKG